MKGLDQADMNKLQALGLVKDTVKDFKGGKLKTISITAIK